LKASIQGAPGTYDHELVPQPTERSTKALRLVDRRHPANPALLLRRGDAFDPGATRAYTFAATDLDGAATRHCYMDSVPHLYTLAHSHLHSSTRCQRNLYVHAHQHAHFHGYANHDPLAYPHSDPYANHDEHSNHHQHSHQHKHIHQHSHQHKHTDEHRYLYTHSDRHCNLYSNCNLYADRHAHADPDTQPYADVDSHIHPNTDVHRHPDPAHHFQRGPLVGDKWRRGIGNRTTSPRMR
jgi:hypothetical protein